MEVKDSLITKKKGRRFFWKLIVLIAVLIFILGVIIGLLIRQDFNLRYTGGAKNADYCIVLGSGYIYPNMKQSESKERLDVGMEYVEKNPETILILSGGMNGDVVSDARGFAKYLAEQGFQHMDKVVLEEQSHNTYENMKYCGELIEKRSAGKDLSEIEIVMITHDYHVLRSKILAFKRGMRPSFIGVPSDVKPWEGKFLKEIVGVVQAVLFLW